MYASVARRPLLSWHRFTGAAVDTRDEARIVEPLRRSSLYLAASTCSSWNTWLRTRYIKCWWTTGYIRVADSMWTGSLLCGDTLRRGRSSFSIYPLAVRTVDELTVLLVPMRWATFASTCSLRTGKCRKSMVAPMLGIPPLDCL